MEGEDILIVKKERGKEKIKVKVVRKMMNNWSPAKYEKILSNRDFNNLAFLLYDLNNMGYPVEKSFMKFKRLLSEPELFFL